MSERDEQAGQPGSPGVRDDDGTRQLPAQEPHGATRVPPAEDWRQQTTPGMTPVRGGAAADPTVGAGRGWNATASGQQGYGTGGFWQGEPGTETAPPYSTRPVSVRRSDSLAALLLVLAGVAAGVSLLLHWVHGSGQDGLTILRSALRTAGDDRGAFFSQGWWEPTVIVLGGGLLFVLGLLMLVPARTHRALGVLALLVALGVTAGVLAPMAQDGWSTRSYDLGWWFTAAVAALGLLGALKALLTGPRSGTAAP
jgi:hypothetical protein